MDFDKAPGFHNSNATDNGKTNINGCTRLLILKNKRSGKISSALMHTYSNNTLKNTGTTYLNINKDFSGNIFFTDLEGQFINGWQYENGKIVGKSNYNGKKNESARAELPEGCESVETDWYERTCIYYDDQSIECSGWEYVGTTVQTYCPDGGGGSRGGISYETVEIINNVDDPCINSNVNYAINSGCKNEIANFINTVFSNSDQFHLQFNDNILTGAQSGSDAYTVTGPMADLIQTMTVITFNNSQLGNASQEYIATNILHEAVHAWINYKYTNPIDNAHQHSLMAGTNRFNLMRAALMEMYPNLSLEDASDLTWGGMYNTIEFTNLPVSERNRVIQKNLDYKSGIKGMSC